MYSKDIVEIRNDVINYFSDKKTNFSEEDKWVADRYWSDWNRIHKVLKDENEQKEAVEKLINKVTDEIWAIRESDKDKENRLGVGDYTETEKALLESEIKEGRKLIKEHQRKNEPVYNVSLTREEVVRLRMFVFENTRKVEQSIIKHHETKREEEGFLSPEEWFNMRRFDIQCLAELRNIAEKFDKLDNVYEGENDDE